MPTEGYCTTVLTFHVTSGHVGETVIDDLSFAVVLRTPGVMAEGGWSVGIIVDERASAEQHDCLVAVACGELGGPLEPMAALTSTFLGVESKPIDFSRAPMRWSVSIRDRVEQIAEGAPSPVKPGEPIYLDNSCHRANPRIALAKAQRNRIHAFGLHWHDDSGTNSSAFAPFDWRVESTSA